MRDPGRGRREAAADVGLRSFAQPTQDGPAGESLELGRASALRPPPQTTRSQLGRSAPTPAGTTDAARAATSGRHHSAATGGGASAFATATPAQSVLLLLGAAPDDAERSAGAQLLQEVALAPLGLEQHDLARREARAASGIPGAPPPETDVDDRAAEPPRRT